MVNCEYPPSYARDQNLVDGISGFIWLCQLTLIRPIFLNVGEI